jgi:L-iditol 2-dehydrogenase
MITSETLPKSMLAGVLKAPHSLQILDIPIWPLTSYGDPDLVMVKVEACGVCGSDFRYFAGENPWAQHTLGQFKPNAPNIVLGHEYAGTVVAVVSEHNKHLMGKRVAPICSKVCRKCDDCLNGREHLCANTVHLGHGQGWGDQPFFPGAYGKYAPAWGASCYIIPDNVSMFEAAMMDILAVCVHVADQGEVKTGQAALIIGGGPAGNGVAQAARSRGASHVVILDQSNHAIEVAQAQGFDNVINTKNLDRVELIKQTRAKGPSPGFGSIFDTVGTEESIDLGLSLLAKGGTFVNMAVHDHQVPFNFLRLSGERKIVTSCNFKEANFKIALKMLEAGEFQLKDWFTPTTLESVPQWFHEIVSQAGEKGVFKLVIDLRD